MEDISRIGIVILAAGASTRFGKPKQLLEFQGKTLLRKAVETALQTGCRRICVVLGANYKTLKKHIEDLPVEITRNAKYKEGMVSSLKSGLKKLLAKTKAEKTQTVEAVIVMLCDQPLIEAKLIEKLVKVFWQNNPLIVACEYSGTYGAPTLFSHLLFNEILQSQLKEGAKLLIEKYRDFTQVVPAPEASIDIDTPQDYQKLCRQGF